MKVLTLNTHSIIEKDYEDKLIKFVEMLKEESPDIIALQEVNQSLTMPETVDVAETGYVVCRENEQSLRMDNHAFRVAKMLCEAGAEYQWTWIPAKNGYGVYDEGISILSKSAIDDTHQFFASESAAYDNWKTRKILGIRTEDIWFYSVHMGWWDDSEEPFAKQWDKVTEQLNDSQQLCFVMGDFNSPADRRREGYDYVMDSGWMDTWQMAAARDNGITVGGAIDGWNGKLGGNLSMKPEGMRIDYIFCNKIVDVISSKVVFNGKNYPVVSDHYGVLIEVDVK